MNVRIKQHAEFLAASYKDDQVVFNKYYVTIELMTQTSDHIQQTIAFERLRYMLSYEFANSIFVDDQDIEKVNSLHNEGFKVIPTPIVPVDQAIAIMLYYKLTAVVEERLVVLDISLISDMGPGFAYQHGEGEHVDQFEAKGWWNDPTPLTYTPRKNKIVTIGGSWSSLDLDWETATTTSSTDEQPASRANVVKFKPDTTNDT